MVAVGLCSVAHAEPAADDNLTTAPYQPGSSHVEPAPEEPPPPVDPAAASPHQRALRVGAALGPGALVHGTGHRLAGDSETADRLLLTEGVGAGLILGGLAGLAVTGASRYTVAPFALMSIAGAGLFVYPVLADAYGVGVPADRRGAPLLDAPVLVSEAGYRYIYDPQFRYRQLLVQSVDLRMGALRLHPSGAYALDDDNARLRLLASYRLFGPGTGRALDGSYLDLEGAVSHHRYDSDGFRILTGELSFLARRDLVRESPALRGSFIEAGAGIAVQSFEYRIDGMSVDSERETLLLARLGVGAYLGNGSEALFYYDHRHDDYAAGLHLTGLGSGVAGHIGIDTRYFFDESWGLRLDARVGSAYIAGASLLFRQK